MKHEDVDEILNRALRGPHDVKSEVLHRIADSLKVSFAPVRPLPSSIVLTAVVFFVCVAVAIAGAARAGFFGFAKMHLMERWIIFGLLGALAWAAARSFVHAMIPGTRRHITAARLLGWSCVALVGLFGLLFRDYETHQFFRLGIACLATGLLYAVPAALFSWLLLRRGFAVNMVTAGLSAGLLGGLAGIGMLELHCPNFEAAHVLVWHIAVAPISSAVGAGMGWLLHLRRASRQ